MKTEVNEISINGVVYVPKGEDRQRAESLDGMQYQIVRTYSAGVFAGYVASRNGQEVVIKKARRLWYWAGAASLSQLAVEIKCSIVISLSSKDLTSTGNSLYSFLNSLFIRQ